MLPTVLSVDLWPPHLGAYVHTQCITELLGGPVPAYWDIKDPWIQCICAVRANYPMASRLDGTGWLGTDDHPLMEFQVVCGSPCLFVRPTSFTSTQLIGQV